MAKKTIQERWKSDDERGNLEFKVAKKGNEDNEIVDIVDSKESSTYIAVEKEEHEE